jgi:hypothetical protein
MRKDWTAPLDAVNFVCTVCRAHWQARPDLVEPDEQATHHPYRYFATCEVCEARHQPQAQWERALMKAHQAATGPKTSEGKAATAANLAGHPTPDEALRTRFNAMKHGMNARVARYFPAKPDGYAFCQGCDVNRRWCQEQPACVKQTELFMLTSAAFEQRDPRVLGKVHSDLHAALVASLQMCLQAVLGDGAVIKTPKLEWVTDKEGGGSHVAVCYVDASGETRYVYDYQANPAFKPIADLVTRLGLSLSDLGMTVQAADEEQNALRGRLPAQQAATGDTLEAFAQRTAAALENLGGTIKAARAAAEQDPVLVEHMAQTGTGEAPKLGAGGKA